MMILYDLPNKQLIREIWQYLFIKDICQLLSVNKCCQNKNVGFRRL